MSNIVATTAALIAAGKTTEEVAKAIKKSGMRLGQRAGKSGAKIYPPAEPVSSSSSTVASSDIDDEGSLKSSGGESSKSSAESSKKAAKKKKAKKAKAERAAARLALAGAALTHARVASRRIVSNHETARVSPMLAKLGIDSAALSRHDARGRVDAAILSADTEAVAYFQRRGVSEADARKMAKSFATDLVGFMQMQKRGESLQRKAG